MARVVNQPLVPAWPLQIGLEAAARVLLKLDESAHVDFARPIGEAALVTPYSVSWRLSKNALSVFIEGVTAVIMELAEPRVRTGVWEHTTFRVDPNSSPAQSRARSHGDDLRRA